MLNFAANTAEKVLIGICKSLIFCVKIAAWVLEKIAIVFEVLAVVLMFVLSIKTISSLPPMWQSIVLKILIYSGATSFTAVCLLCFWRPAKFKEIFDELN